MAAPAQQSPFRRWTRFFRAFESVDAAIESFDPAALSRHEFRRARAGIVNLLRDAADDDHAERLCLVLDDVMAESLQTLRLIPLMPTVLANTDIVKSVRALQKNHESERVRVLAADIVTAWRASVQDDAAKVRETATHKLPQHKTIEHQALDARRTTRPAAAKIVRETSAKKTAEITNRASEPVAPGIVFRGDHVGPIPEEKMQAAKRKFNQRYQEADDAKRQRRPIHVVAPEMLKQRQKKQHPIMRARSQARCGSSIVKKTFTVTRLAS